MAKELPLENTAHITEIEQEPETMNISTPPEKSVIIEDGTLVDVYQEILQQCRDDRRECDNYLTNFVEMVINEGDSTTSSKEALVNLMKIKTDISDKMSKIAGEMTRVKLKEKYDITPKNIETQTNNHIHLEGDRRSLIELIENARRGSANNEENGVP